MRRHLTIRNVPPDLAKALEQEKRRRRVSLNDTVLTVLRDALGVGAERRSNGLARLAARWSEEQFQEFETAVATTSEEIDEETWR